MEAADDAERRGFNEPGRVNLTSRGESGGEAKGDSDE
jgi:hypothetical protein